MVDWKLMVGLLAIIFVLSILEAIQLHGRFFEAITNEGTNQLKISAGILRSFKLLSASFTYYEIIRKTDGRI